MSKLYIGLMSGTSIDGMDGALVDFSNHKPQLLQTASVSFPDKLQDQLHQLCSPGHNEVHQLGLASRELGDIAAVTVNKLLEQHNLEASSVTAIGFHGQTIRHHPELGFTLQIGDASRIAEQTSITTVADFRSRDVAAGGQGAPLAPFFHQALCDSDKQSAVVLNIGGLANISVMPSVQNPQLCGFDTGPGNTLMDAWCRKHLGKPFDSNGQWAQSGQVSEKLLQALMATPYLQLSPPKSTGRELFNLEWLLQHLQNFQNLPPQDVQATLCAFTAESIALAITQYAANRQQVFVCGGGADNSHLMTLLQQQLPNMSINTTAALGIDPQWIEAAAFAWLSMQTMESNTIALPSITGASGKRILGAIYQA
ncbi:anhydro-N-acetylmuramic acid kinase [Spongorhabdus nitratireducens]